MVNDSVRLSISEYKAQAASKAALGVLDNGVETVKALEGLLSSYFSTPNLSHVQKAFEEELSHNGVEAVNASLHKVMPLVRDAVALCTSHIQTIEAWIMLATPAMEDGGNFGVSIQLDVLKALKETRESWSKLLADEFVKYYDARAGAVEKFGIQKSTSSTTTTNTQQTEKAKDEETSKSTATTVQETKISGIEPQIALTASWGFYRVQHLVALDLQMYTLLQVSLQQLINTYSSVLDSVEKNYAKLAFPKGTGGGRGRHMMM